MEIPELNIISDFTSGIQNPTLFPSQFVSISGPPNHPRYLVSFWKWVALIFTLIATFRAIITRTKLLILRFCTDKFLSPTQNLNYDSDTDHDSSSSSSSSACSSEDYQEHEEEDNTEPWVFSSRGFGVDDSDGGNCGNVVAMWDVSKGERLNSVSPPAIIFSAGVNIKGNVLLSGYDRRVRRREIPVICAEWRQEGVRDDVSGGALMMMVVGDMRNVKTPLLLEDRNRMGSDGDAWFDADAVNFWEESVDD